MKNTLESFLPHPALTYINQWLTGYHCDFKITKNRKSKLGDYRLMPNGTHQISINGDVSDELFFFIITHEIAHLLAFYEKKNIVPHGKEWKNTFKRLLIESLHVYSEELQPLMLRFSKNPKANFMSSPELAKFFEPKLSENQSYIEELFVGEQFIYQTQTYLVEEKKKKRYLCKNIHNNRRYFFKTCTKVEKLKYDEHE